MTVTVRLIFPDGSRGEKRFVGTKSCERSDDGGALALVSNDGVGVGFNWQYVYEVIFEEDEEGKDEYHL